MAIMKLPVNTNDLQRCWVIVKINVVEQAKTTNNCAVAGPCGTSEKLVADWHKQNSILKEMLKTKKHAEVMRLPILKWRRCWRTATQNLSRMVYWSYCD